MSVSDRKQLNRIKQVFGNWAVMQENENAMIAFNGLPGYTKKSDDKATGLVLPESVLEKGKELQQWERVYEVKHIGPDFGKLWDGEKFVAASNDGYDLEVGDLIICKGNVFKIFMEPASYAFNMGHVICKVGHVNEDGEINI